MVEAGSGLPFAEWRKTEANWLLVYLFLWTVISLVAATTTFIALQGTTVQGWFTVLLRMLRYFYVWGAMALLIIWLLHRFPPSRRNIWVIAPVHVVLLVLMSVSMPFLFHTENWREWQYGSHATAFHALNALVYSFVLIGTQMVRYYRLGLLRERDAQRAELRSMRLEKDLSQAKIDTLRIQMNPHFLFNALNSICSLIATSHKSEAIRMTGLLGSLLRAALEQTKTTLVSLSEELEFLQKYIEIEKIRFGDRLTVDYSVPPNCLSRPVPSLILQPIVENVIKHAVSPATSTVTVDFRVFCDLGQLIFEVADTGPGLSEPPTYGCGLRNVTDRLALLYGEQARLSITNRAKGGALVRLSLPAGVAARGNAPAAEKEVRRLAN